MATIEPSQDCIWVPPAFGGSEGGYTFLKRMLQSAINERKPVIFGDGSREFQFTYNASHAVFFEGVEQLDSVPAGDIIAYETDKNMKNYGVALGVKELVRDGKITLPDVGGGSKGLQFNIT